MRANRNILAEEAAYGKGVWFWHPWLVSSWRRLIWPDRASIDRQSVSDGGQRNSAPGRARYRPLKPLRREGRVFRRTCSPPCAPLCARLRVSWAPGLPCALFFWAKDGCKSSGAPRRGMIARVKEAVIASEAKQSIPPRTRSHGLLRRFAPRNDAGQACWLFDI
jgi:hypothetical protein